VKTIYCINYISKADFALKLKKVKKNSIVVVGFSKSNLFKLKGGNLSSNFFVFVKSFANKNNLLVIIGAKVINKNCVYIIYKNNTIKVLGEIFDKACIVRDGESKVGVVYGESVYSPSLVGVLKKYDVLVVIGVVDDECKFDTKWLGELYDNRLVLSFCNVVKVCCNKQIKIINI